MHAVVGPIVTREGGYAFDSWTLEGGLHRGYAYRRIEDANYAAQGRDQIALPRLCRWDGGMQDYRRVRRGARRSRSRCGASQALSARPIDLTRGPGIDSVPYQ
jgi:hypothetical protein